MIEAYIHRFLKSYDIADKIICPSQFMLDKLMEAGINQNKLLYIPNFVCHGFHSVKKNLNNRKREKSIIYFGRISSEKGIEILLFAKEQLPADIKLKIIGTGPEEDKLRKMTKKMHLKNVEFLGFKESNALYDEIKSCWCTIIPTLVNEVFGLTIVESFICGTPVIGSEVGGIPEIIKDGENGFLFKPGNTKDLVEKITRIFSLSDEEYSAMSRNCLNGAEQYSPQNYYNSLLSVYNELL